MREISIIKKRILQYLDFKGISKYESYQKTGITNGVFSQLNGMSEESLLKFLNYYTDLSADWLILGIEPMLRDGFVEEKKEEKKDIPIKVIDKDSIGFILDRYESLAAENALLKRENEELKLLIDEPTQSIPYTDNSLNLGTNIAAEPKNK